jgi:hypothetical protein
MTDMPDEKAPNEATTHLDQYHRHEQSDENWEEADAVTGRENDTPLRGDDKYAVPNSTMAERAKARKPAAKQVEKAAGENKAVAPKQVAKKAAKK